MSRKEPPRAATLAAVLARALPDARPGAIAWAVGRMTDAAQAHKRWAEACCTYPMTDGQVNRGDRRMERLAEAAWEALRQAAQDWRLDPAIGRGLIVTDELDAPRAIALSFGRDPRGPCGSLHISDMPGDGFGPGWSIYA